MSTLFRKISERRKEEPKPKSKPGDDAPERTTKISKGKTASHRPVTTSGTKSKVCTDRIGSDRVGSDRIGSDLISGTSERELKQVSGNALPRPFAVGKPKQK